jgi:hypothetical protein
VIIPLERYVSIIEKMTRPNAFQVQKDLSSSYISKVTSKGNILCNPVAGFLGYIFLLSIGMNPNIARCLNAYHKKEVILSL